MSNIIVIPTVGLGSRIGKITKYINKSLLPYKNKPILAHIIERFPVDSNFVILTGYKSDQVKDFCNLAFNDRNITYVDVDDWTSKQSGTAYSLKKCSNLINSPFWYVPCDTYFEENILTESLDYNCYFVKEVQEKETSLYTMFELVDSTIKTIEFKNFTPSNWKAFTGLMYIHDYINFFKELETLDSNEFIHIIKPGSKTKILNSWLDFGNLEIYNEANKKDQKFDFSKTEEFTYICNDKVIKWFNNELIPLKKQEKFLANHEIFPKNCKQKGNFISYSFEEGTTLYEYDNIDVFEKLLDWMKINLWKISNKDIVSNTLDFYKNKTLSRVELFLKKYPTLEFVSKVNGVEIKEYDFYLNKIDWNYLTKTAISSFVHGDLQFDNIIITKNKEFKLIDWRPDFSGLTDAGDLYYDIAKLSGGLIIDYSKIKKNEFKFQLENSNVELTIPHINNFDYYEEKMKQFILDNKLDYYKVKLLTAIIYLNMSPLHHYPFDKFLWFLSLKLFSELENEKIYKH